MTDKNREPLPSLYTEGGYVSFAIGELWELVKESVPAADLAENLFQSAPEVRDRLREMVLRKWDSFTDAERREMIAALQLHIHNRQLDDLVSSLGTIEANVSKIAWHSAERQAFTNYLRAIHESLAAIAPEVADEIKRRHGDDPFHVLAKQDQIDHTATIGPHWHQAREFWRNKLVEIFTAPEQPPPTSEDVVSAEWLGATP